MIGLSISLEDPEAWRKVRATLALGQDIDRHVKISVLAELQYLRKRVLEVFKNEGPPGSKWPALSPITIAVRSFEGFKGTKILQVTRDLMGSISVIPDGELGGFVGVARTKARKDGQDPVNLARLHEQGATFAHTVTPAQRRYLFAALAAAGLNTAPPAGHARSFDGPVTGTTIVIKIPPRPFLGPVFDVYARPEDLALSIVRRVCKKLGGQLGQPDGGAPRE